MILGSPASRGARLGRASSAWRALRASAFLAEEARSKRAPREEERHGGPPLQAEKRAAAWCQERMIHATRSVAYGCSRQGLTRFATSLWVGPLPAPRRGSVV